MATHSVCGRRVRTLAALVAAAQARQSIICVNMEDRPMPAAVLLRMTGETIARRLYDKRKDGVK